MLRFIGSSLYARYTHVLRFRFWHNECRIMLHNTKLQNAVQYSLAMPARTRRRL